MTHCRLSREKCSDLPIDGSATLTIETSRIVMKNAAQTTVSAFQRSGSASAIPHPFRFGSPAALNASHGARIPT